MFVALRFVLTAANDMWKATADREAGNHWTTEGCVFCTAPNTPQCTQHREREGEGGRERGMEREGGREGVCVPPPDRSAVRLKLA